MCRVIDLADLTPNAPPPVNLSNVGGGCGWVCSKKLCYGLWYPTKCVMEQKAEFFFCTNLQDTTVHFYSESEPKARQAHMSFSTEMVEKR